MIIQILTERKSTRKMDIKKIFRNNQEWAEKRRSSDKDYFKRLSKGQDPDILYIGCSDSRVSAEEMMGLAPGEAFVHRNIANLVPNTDLNVMSVINFAVRHLCVKHIVVCGHYNCGGISAALLQKDMGILNPWLRSIRDVYRLHKAELDSIEDHEARNRKLVELNVEEQCINVIKTAVVQEAYFDRRLRVSGWVFDIHSGMLKDLEIDFESILEKVMDIYRIRR